MAPGHCEARTLTPKKFEWPCETGKPCGGLLEIRVLPPRIS